MHFFHDMSIKRKIILIIILTSWATLTVASLAFLVQDIISFRQAIVNDISSVAQVIGMNSSGALVFNDPRTAEKNLSALMAKPHVSLACIYDKEGKIFAAFPSRIKNSDLPVLSSQTTKYYFKNNYLFLFQQIYLEEDLIGMIFIQSDLKEIRSRVKQSISIVGIIISIAFLLAMILSILLQRFISEPILNPIPVNEFIKQPPEQLFLSLLQSFYTLIYLCYVYV